MTLLKPFCGRFNDLLMRFNDLFKDTGKGNLFVSDDDGIMYTKSLEDHFVSILM